MKDESEQKREVTRLKDRVSADEQLRVQQRQSKQTAEVKPPAEPSAPSAPSKPLQRPKFSEPAEVQQAKLKTPAQIESRTTAPAPKIQPKPPAPMANAQLIPPQPPQPIDAPPEPEQPEIHEQNEGAAKDDVAAMADEIRNLRAYCELLDKRFEQLDQLYAPLTDEVLDFGPGGVSDSDTFPTHVVFRASGSTAVPSKTARYLWIDTVNETLVWSASGVSPNPGIVIVLDSQRREFVVMYP